LLLFLYFISIGDAVHIRLALHNTQSYANTLCNDLVERFL